MTFAHSARSERAGRDEPAGTGAAPLRAVADVEAFPGGRNGAGPALFVLVDDETDFDLEASHFVTMGAGASVFALRVRRAERLGLRTVQGIAARLVDQIREIRPAGPYRVAGLRAAGVLAHEVGVQLAGDDARVEFLAAVDCRWDPWAIRRARGEARGSGAVARAILRYEVEPSPLTLHLVAPAADVDRDSSCGWSAAFPPERLRRSAVTADLPEARPALIDGLCLAAREAEAAEGECAAPPYLAAVTIKSGARGAVPLFCVPGAGASVTDFVPLAMVVAQEQPVVSFEARGMDPAHLPRSTVTAAAEAYVAELVAMHPRGPVNLVGHSFGGWIALDMAMRLRSLGRDVRSLTIVDSECPGGPGTVGKEYTRAEALMELVALYELAAERPLGVTLEELEARDPEAQLALLHARLVAVGLMPQRSAPGLLRGPIRSFEAAVRTWYAPQASFDGTTRLVLVSGPTETPDAAERRFEQEVAGWRRVAPRVEATRGTGNHVTILKAPNVAHWARWISR